MEPVIAIHKQQDSFSARWVEYCKAHNINHIIVDMFDTEILSKLRHANVNGFLYNLPLHDLKTQLFADKIARAIEMTGIKVFPSTADYWHFDDKVAQKYLFETMLIPTCQTWVFFDRKEALQWVSEAVYPKIFKLRKGAGSHNVQMVKSVSQAETLVNRMFNNGLKPVSTVITDFRTKIYRHKTNRDWINVLKRLPDTLKKISAMKKSSFSEKGYVYFQEYLPGNDHDTRVTVIGHRAFAFRRFVRPNDFRASGSGRIDWSQDAIDQRCLQIAFDASKKIGSNCLAFDFVYDDQREPRILEVCYAFMPGAVHDCPGYWDDQLRYHNGQLQPEDLMIGDLIASISMECCKSMEI